MTDVIRTRIDDFVCPACGEFIGQVTAKNGVVKGWCHTAKIEIEVVVDPAQEEAAEKKAEEPVSTEPLTYLDNLKQKRAKVLADLVSAKEDGDLKENSAYHAAREQLVIIDYKIVKEEERLKQEAREG